MGSTRKTFWLVSLDNTVAVGYCGGAMNATLITGMAAVELAERDGRAAFRMERDCRALLVGDEPRWLVENHPEVVVAVIQRPDGSFVGPDDDDTLE